MDVNEEQLAKALEAMTEGEKQQYLQDIEAGKRSWSDFKADLGNKWIDLSTDWSKDSPHISGKDRFLIKNFGGTPEESVEVLKKDPKYKNIEFKVKDNHILTKKKGEEFYTPIDSPYEVNVKDLTDVAADVGTGILEAGGAAAGAVGGGLPGAIAGGAVGGALSSSVKQAVGKSLGLRKSLDPAELAVETALGASGPLAEKFIGAAAKLATNKITPATAGALTGVPARVWERYIESPGRAAELTKNTDMFGKLVNDTRESVLGSIQDQSTKLGEELSRIYANASQRGALVDIAPVKQEFQKILQDVRGQTVKLPTQAMQEEADAITKTWQKYFTESVPSEIPGEPAQIMEIPDKIDPLAAWRLRKQLDAVAEVDSGPGSISEEAKAITKDIRLGAMRARKKLSEGLTSLDPELKAANERYSELADDAYYIRKNFKDVPTALNTVKNWNKQSKDYVNRLVQKNIQDPNVVDTLNKQFADIQVQAFLANPALLPISGGSTTSTSRTAMGAALGKGLGTAGYMVAGRPGEFLGWTAGLGATSPKVWKGTTGALGYGQEALRTNVGQAVAKPTLYGTWGQLKNYLQRNKSEEGEQ